MNVARFSIGSGIALVLLASLSFAAEKENPREGSAHGLRKVQTQDVYRAVTVGNVFNYYGNNGDGSHNPFTYGSGFEFPPGSGKTTVYQEGIVWGGYHNGALKVGGSTYNHGLQAGRILTPGSGGTSPIADNPLDASYRVYCVRTDVNPNTPLDAAMTAKLQAEVNLISRYQTVNVSQLYASYLADWNAWPANMGAPFTDVNGNGTYEPGVDIPGVAGADQTLWYVANDVNASRTYGLYGSSPIGIEMQRTIWSTAGEGFLGNSVFARTKLINKSGMSVDTMYITQWADPDLGDAGDDFVGCDVPLSLGYVYNGAATDNVYGVRIPSTGFVFLQGPIVAGSLSDSAYFQGRTLKGYRNLGLSSFNMFVSSNATYLDPQLGNPVGTTQWYRLMKGLVGTSGATYVDPTTGQPTKFVFSGDPVTGTGWLDGTIAPPGDRRMAQTVGPFTLANGDTQEVVVGALTMQGSDRLASVRLLKQASSRIWKYYRNLPVVSLAPLQQAIYPLHQDIHLQGRVILAQGKPGTGQWTLLQVPDGSSATVQVIDSANAAISPDLPGSYIVALIAGAGTQFADTGSVTIAVTSNTPPSVSWTFPSTITVGDSLVLDGSDTWDVDGDSLTFAWSSASFFSDFITPYDTLKSLFNPNQEKAGFIARKAGIYNVTLSVRDSSFTVPLTRQISVSPISAGTISRTAAYKTALYPNNSGYYYFPRFLPQDGSLWAQVNGSPFQLDLNDLVHPLQEYPNVIGTQFVVAGSLLVTNASSSGFGSFVTDLHGGFLSSMMYDPDNSPSYSVDTTVTGLLYANPYLYVSDGLAGVYTYDCTNPQALVKSGHFWNGDFWGGLVQDNNNHVLSYNRRTGKMLVLDVSTPNTLTKPTEFSTPVPLQRFGSLYAGLSHDTLFVYSWSGSYPLTLQSATPVPRTVNPYSTNTSVWIDGTTLAVGTTEGVYVYDVTTPSAPAMLEKYVTGWYTSTVYLTGGRLLTAFVRGGDFAYEGINDFQVGTTAVDAGTEELPARFELEQNFPNPFNPQTRIRYQLPAASSVTLRVFDLLGRVVQTLVRKWEQAGAHVVTFDSRGLSTGLYIYRLEASPGAGDKAFVSSRKMLVIK